MKRSIKTFIISAAVAVALLGNYSCIDSVDLMTEDATEGGLVVPAATNLSFIGNPINISAIATAGITEVSFYKTYTKSGVTSSEVLDQSIAISDGQIDFTLNYAALKAGLTGMPDLAADLAVSDYWTFRIVSKLDDGREIQNGRQIKIVVDNPYSGKYHTFGSITRETSVGVFSTSTYEDDKDMTTLSSASCETLAAWGVFANPGLLFQLTVNPDNTVIIEPSKNPARAADISGSPGKVSTYDPATKTFMLYYEYTNGSGLKRIMSEKSVRK